MSFVCSAINQELSKLENVAKQINQMKDLRNELQRIQIEEKQNVVSTVPETGFCTFFLTRARCLAALAERTGLIFEQRAARSKIKLQPSHRFRFHLHGTAARVSFIPIPTKE